MSFLQTLPQTGLNDWALLLAGLITGLIDAIAGGGGLISLPAMTLAVGAGPDAIGTNKIVGTTAALIALVVYQRKGHFDWRKSATFAGWVGLGSLMGSRLSPLLPLEAFKVLMLITCPLILWIVWRKDLWIARELQTHPKRASGRLASLYGAWGAPKLIATGVLCGLYDGLWGPGGGTFMFLGLLFVARLPLLVALAASKFANTLSAAIALISYAQAGFVHWKTGGLVALGVAVGAFIGANLALRNLSGAIRPALALVSGLLLIRVLTQ
jgi:uncharacterized membrane protein YfcA